MKIMYIGYSRPKVNIHQPTTHWQSWTIYLFGQYDHEWRRCWTQRHLPDREGSLGLPAPFVHLAVKYQQSTSQDLPFKCHRHTDSHIRLWDCCKERWLQILQISYRDRITNEEVYRRTLSRALSGPGCRTTVPICRASAVSHKPEFQKRRWCGRLDKTRIGCQNRSLAVWKRLGAFIKDLDTGNIIGQSRSRRTYAGGCLLPNGGT